MQTTWAKVQIGDIVLGKDKQGWACTARNADRFVLERDGREPYLGTMPLSADVTLVSSAAEEMQEATARVEGALGAQVLHTGETGQPPSCPPDYAEPGTMLAHLYHLHGVPVNGTDENATLSDLNDLHEKAHEVRGVGYTHHHHTPDYLERNR